MLIGVPTEIMNNENRVALTKGGVHELVKAGHTLLVQTGAGKLAQASRMRIIAASSDSSMMRPKFGNARR